MISIKLAVIIACTVVVICAKPTPGSSASEMDLEELGCWKEEKSSFATPKRDVFNARTVFDDMTQEKCVMYCKREGYQITAIYFGRICFCGNFYGRYGKASNEMCDIKCPGNNNQTCGGNGYNSLFKTNHICVRQNSCMNNGRCLPKKPEDDTVIEDYTCQCQEGYNGTQCEIRMCSTNPCENGATCTDEVGGYSCKCTDNNKFVGRSCAKKDFCKVGGTEKCKNGGICISRENKFECLCPLDYAGVNCQLQKQPCRRTPCKNGATCTEINGKTSFKCECPNGFEGETCTATTGSIAMCLSHKCTGKNCLVKTFREDMNRCLIGEGFCFVEKHNNDESIAGCAKTCEEGSESTVGTGGSKKTIKCCQTHECNEADFEMSAEAVGRLLGNGVNLASSAFVLVAGLLLHLLH